MIATHWLASEQFVPIDLCWRKGMVAMTDEEIICEFMEPMSEPPDEARLTEEQWEQYASLMMDHAGIQHTRFLLHADAATKIRALAAVL